MAPGVGGGNVVERLLVELGVDANQLLTGVDKATGQAAQKAEEMGSRSSAVMTKIAAAAAIAGGAIAAIFSVKTVASAISYTDEYAASVRKLARETGMTTEQSSEMLFAFRRVGLDSDAASASLGILAKKLKGVQDEETGVATGGKSTAQILADIGIQATDGAGNLRPMTELMPELADVFKGMPDGIEKTGLAMQLFGRSGKDMIPLLNLGSQGMADLAAEANKLGLVLSAENAAKIKQYSVAHKTLTEAVGGLKLVIGIAVIPVVTKLLNLLIKAQPIIRQGLGKSVQWLTTVFIGLWTYLKHVVKTGDTLDEYFKGAHTPLAAFFLLLGETVNNLKSIAEWLLKAAGAVFEWGQRIADLLPDGRSAADNFDILSRFIPLVADAVAALLVAMVITTVVGFVGAIADFALGIVTFPLGVLKDVIGAVGDFVSATAQLVNKAVTITQNVVRTGAKIIEFLADVAGTVFQNVIRTGAKIIDVLNPVTGTVTQSVDITPPADAGEGAKGWFAALMANVLGGLGGSPEVLKAIGLFASGVIAGIGASLGSGISITAITTAISGAISSAAAAVGATLVAITPVGWVIIAAVVVALILTALAVVFREKLGPFFKDTLPRLFTEALPQFAASLPAWAGAVAGFIAGALVFALLGIPALLITRVAPAMAEGIAGIFRKIPWGKIGGAFAGLAGLVGGWLGGAFKAIPGLLGPVGNAIQKFATSIPGWIGNALKAVPGLFVEAVKAIPGLFADLAVAIKKFAASVPGWIAEAFASLPGILAGAGRLFIEFAQNVPRWIAEAFGKIPEIARGALTGAAGLVGVVTGALGDVLGAIMATPIGQAVSWFVGQLVEGFKAGWNQVNEITGGALNDLTGKAWEIVEGVVGAIAALPGRLAGLAGSLFSGALGLGGAIFDGIMSGLKAVPEALGDLTGAILAVFKTAINAGINAINAIIPDKLGVSIMGHWIGFDIPDNPIPTLDFDQGGIVPGPLGAPVLAMVHGGEEILRPDQRGAPVFQFSWAFHGYDWDAIRRAMHAEADRALNEAMGQAERHTYLAGAPLSPYVG